MNVTISEKTAPDVKKLGFISLGIIVQGTDDNVVKTFTASSIATLITIQPLLEQFGKNILNSCVERIAGYKPVNEDVMNIPELALTFLNSNTH